MNFGNVMLAFPKNKHETIPLFGDVFDFWIVQPFPDTAFANLGIKPKLLSMAKNRPKLFTKHFENHPEELLELIPKIRLALATVIVDENGSPGPALFWEKIPVKELFMLLSKLDLKTEDKVKK